MTAPAVFAPAAPSIGPGLKPSNRSLACTSWTSVRFSGIWFGVDPTSAGWSPLVVSVLAALSKPMLAGPDGGNGDAGSGGASTGWLFAVSFIIGSAARMRSLAAGDGNGDDCAVDDGLNSGATGVGAVATDSSGTGHNASIGAKLAMPEPTTAPSAKPSANLRRRLRTRSYACRAARRAAFVTSGSTTLS